MIRVSVKKKISVIIKKEKKKKFLPSNKKSEDSMPISGFSVSGATSVGKRFRIVRVHLVDWAEANGIREFKHTVNWSCMRGNTGQVVRPDLSIRCATGQLIN